MHDETPPQDHPTPEAPRNESHSTCAKCDYNLTNIDPSGNCPECGTPIINGCIWCEYDLSGTDPDGRCPECGVPVVHSIGRSALGSVSTQRLRSIHLGFRMVTVLILAYIIAIICMVLSLVLGMFMLNTGGAFMFLFAGIALLTVLIPFGVVIGWFKLSKPMDALPQQLDAPERRKQLRVSLWVLLVSMLLLIGLGFVFSLLQVNQSDWVLEAYLIAARLILFTVLLISFIFMVRYMGWFARLVRNRKMYRRSKHLVWSGPVIAILGLPLLFLGPLITLILYWNMVEYIRRDLKKIINARATT